MASNFKNPFIKNNGQIKELQDKLEEAFRGIGLKPIISIGGTRLKLSDYVTELISYQNGEHRSYHNSTRETSPGHLYQFTRDYTISAIKTFTGLVSTLTHDVIHSCDQNKRPFGYMDIGLNVSDDINFTKTTTPPKSAEELVNNFFNNKFISKKRETNPDFAKNEFQSALYIATILEENGVKPNTIKKIVANIASTVPFLGSEYIDSLDQTYDELSKNGAFIEDDTSSRSNAKIEMRHFAVKDIENMIASTPYTLLVNSVRVSMELIDIKSHNLASFKDTLVNNITNDGFNKFLNHEFSKTLDDPSRYNNIVPYSKILDKGLMSADKKTNYKDLAENGIRNIEIYRKEFTQKTVLSLINEAEKELQTQKSEVTIHELRDTFLKKADLLAQKLSEKYQSPEKEDNKAPNAHRK